MAKRPPSRRELQGLRPTVADRPAASLMRCPADQGGRQIHRVVAVPAEHRSSSAGVAVANGLTAAVAAAGTVVAGREGLYGKPGYVNLPVEECVESVVALFQLRPVESGARLQEHVALGPGGREPLPATHLDNRVVGRQKVPRIVPTNIFSQW